MPAPQPYVSYSQIGDLQLQTLPELNRFRVVDLSTDVQQFLVMNMLLRQSNVETVESGKSFQWTCIVNPGGTAANVGPGYQDKVVINDTTALATADWRQSKVDWAMISAEEQMNASPAKIVDLKMLREKTAAIDFVQLMERNWFGPPVAVTDLLTPWGMKTWIVKNATEGFNGGAPSGYTTIGLNPTTYPRWKNYTFLYSAVDDYDFVDKLKRMARLTDWKPPVEGLPLLAPGNKRMYLTNEALLSQLEALLKASNDNLGMDILKYSGQVTINRTACTWVPYLAADTTNPIYQVCLDDAKIYRLKNHWMRRTELPNTPGRHTVASTYLDSQYQFVWINRRRSGVGATATTEPS